METVGSIALWKIATVTISAIVAGFGGMAWWRKASFALENKPKLDNRFKELEDKMSANVRELQVGQAKQRERVSVVETKVDDLTKAVDIGFSKMDKDMREIRALIMGMIK